MKTREEKILGILGIARATRERSLQQALADSSYAELRPELSVQDLLPLIESVPAFVDDWLQYSADKRCSGGWFVLPDGQLGRIEDPGSTERFALLPVAVANFVVRELKWWRDLAAAGSNDSRKDLDR
jgi:hypothetical protein